MNVFQSILELVKNLLHWWFIVQPWEQAIRVRLGKDARLFGPGLHFRMPFLDSVYIQNTRRRLMYIGAQTLTTSDGKLITLHSTLGFTIEDVMLLQSSLHDATATIQQHVMGLLANDVALHILSECTPCEVIRRTRLELDLTKYGLGQVELALTGYVANVRTVRVLNDQLAPYLQCLPLSTEPANTSLPK